MLIEWIDSTWINTSRFNKPLFLPQMSPTSCCLTSWRKPRNTGQWSRKWWWPRPCPQCSPPQCPWAQLLNMEVRFRLYTQLFCFFCIPTKVKVSFNFSEKNPTIWHRFNTRIILFIAPLTLNLEINVDGGDRPTNVGMPGSHFSEEEVSEILQDLLH